MALSIRTRTEVDLMAPAESLARNPLILSLPEDNNRSIGYIDDAAEDQDTASSCGRQPVNLKGRWRTNPYSLLFV